MLKDIHQFTIFESIDGSNHLYNNNTKQYIEITEEIKQTILDIINNECNSEKTTSSIAQ